MLTIIENPEKELWNSLLLRPTADRGELDTLVRSILKDVKSNGDRAVDLFSSRFEEVRIANRRVTKQELEGAEMILSEELKNAIQQAHRNIEAFHRNQIISAAPLEILPGIDCWQRAVPIDKVGLYIPGGTAPLFSTLLMLGIPATLAGCSEIIVCSPPQKDGNLNAAILYTANLLGIKKVFRIGGAQAIAAMAYGTATVPKVFKIFGPGNQFVTHAKKVIQQEGTAIDMPAGPSELAIFADDSAIPEFVSADLLSQCEHGPDSHVVLVAANRNIAERVNAALNDQIERLPRREIALKALQHSRLFVISNPEIALDLINEYAPEHLILACRNSESLALGVRNAGSVFLGNYAPESAGDYATGTNHTLPTNGFARAYSGVSMDSFLKKISFQQLTKEGLNSIGKTVINMAVAEGLEGHAEAIRIRLPG